MQAYRHILLAADFAAAREPVAERARQLAALCGARLSLLHVVDRRALTATDAPPLAGQNDDEPAAAAPNLMDSARFAHAHDDALLAGARGFVRQLGARLGVAPEDCHAVETESVRDAIVATARDIGADLLVLGLHDRQWWEFTRSTAGRVLGGAPCDVLVVRVADEAHRPSLRARAEPGSGH